MAADRPGPDPRPGATRAVRGARVLVHVQHLLGTGHLWRALALAQAMVARGMQVLVLSGGMPVPGTAALAAAAGVLLRQLPPARAADAGYGLLLDQHGAALDARWQTARIAAVRAALREHRPDVLITETYPLGRRRLRAEMHALLDDARAAPWRCRMVCSVRDILEGFPGPAGRVETALEVLHRYYDALLVHGDADLVPLQASFPDAGRIALPIHHTGYVAVSGAAAAGPAVPAGPLPQAEPVGQAEPLPQAEPAGQAEPLPQAEPAARAGRAPRRLPPGEVLISTGGGAVGAELVAAALQAHACSALADRPWRVLVGHNLAADRFEQLRRQAPAGVIVERNRSDFRSLLGRCSVSVSQAGYNTVVDVLQCRARAVLVPFQADGQLEQGRRARLLAARGLALVLTAQPLDGETLAAALQQAATRPAPTWWPRLDGAAAGAARVAQLLGAGDDARP